MENTETNSNANKQVESFVDIISTNTKIENLILLLGQINFDTVDSMIEKTPDDLKDTLNYKILYLLKDFNTKIVEYTSENPNIN